MFEHRNEKLLPVHQFVRRIFFCLAMAAGLVIFGVGIGTLGYHKLADFTWIDSLLNACMILAGMGPVGTLPNDASKLFASFYALFSGLVFISIVALLVSPVVHRILHKFHVADEDFEPGGE